MKRDCKNEKWHEFKALLSTMKYTQKEIAEQLGISQHTVNTWSQTIHFEKGKQPRSFRHRQKQSFTQLFLTGKYTQKEIAEQIGITQKTATQWKSNYYMIQNSKNLFIKLVDREQLSVDEMAFLLKTTKSKIRDMYKSHKRKAFNELK